MYELADNIVGALQLAEQMKFDDAVSTATTVSALTAKSTGTSAAASAPPPNSVRASIQSIQSIQK